MEEHITMSKRGERRLRKQVVDDERRRAPASQIDRGPVRLMAHQSAVHPDLDLGRLNQLADELEDEGFLAAARRSR